MDLTPTTVINGTGFDYKVTVFPALVTQSLNGSFDFAETPRNLAASKTVLTTASVTPKTHVLAVHSLSDADLAATFGNVDSWLL